MLAEASLWSGSVGKRRASALSTIPAHGPTSGAVMASSVLGLVSGQDGGLPVGLDSHSELGK